MTDVDPILEVLKTVTPHDPRIGCDIARMLGRSQWSVLLLGGRIVSEWNEVEWYDVPAGKRAMRLYTPIGRYAEFGDATGSRTLDGFVWQLKKADLMVGAGIGEQVAAHVVGCVDQPDGGCELWAYEYGERRLVGPKRDNAHFIAYRQIGPISALHLGLRPEFASA
jgi:hypothetical protein